MKKALGQDDGGGGGALTRLVTTRRPRCRRGPSASAGHPHRPSRPLLRTSLVVSQPRTTPLQRTTRCCPRSASPRVNLFVSQDRTAGSRTGTNGTQAFELPLQERTAAAGGGGRRGLLDAACAGARADAGGGQAGGAGGSPHGRPVARVDRALLRWPHVRAARWRGGRGGWPAWQVSGTPGSPHPRPVVGA